MGLLRGLLVPVCLLSWCLLTQVTHQLQSSQTQVLMQLRKHLEYPTQLEIWKDHTVDFCYMSSPGQVNITCDNNVVTELRIAGWSGWQTRRLSDQFSTDSFFATLARLNNLRVLSLVNLGLWGPLPDKIGRLSALTFMDLSSNFLSGPIPPKISKIKTLQTLVLSHNSFNGSLPDWSDSLPHLSLVDVRNNRLSSELPKFPKSLLMAFLSNNSLTGGIPSQYARIAQLQQLDLSFNSLTGMPPAGIFALRNLSYLNLARNALTGSFSNHFACSSSLKFVDISNNKFSGQLPACLGAKVYNRTINYSWNCLSVESRDQHNASYCEEAAVESQVHHHHRRHVATVVAIIAIIFTSVAFLACVLLIICRRFCGRGASEQHLLHKTASPAAFSTELITTARFISDTAKLGSPIAAPVCRSFSLEELRDATKNFDNSNYMGGGSNGKLYRGRLEDGTQVAIRCLPLPKKYTIRNLKLRLDLLAKPRHPHLVCLLGHCIDGGLNADPSLSKVFLIYEYVPCGNFRTHLSEENADKILNWFDRLTVLIGVAKAVHFLHTGVIPSFLNNRLKTNNILISEHGVAKLSDYGLSIISEEIEKPDGLKLLQACFEDDVYNFGIIILETLVGPKMAARREEIIHKEMARFDSQAGRKGLVEQVVLATSSGESLSVLVSLMNKCISTETVNRPSFEDVLWNLQYAAQIQTSDGEQRQ
uniref:Protein kinase domain-containing protein n=1 Tax=Kalanchoe fedtschenkoi TaxID=63787 RepID=A0A7N0VEN7_KALFE